MVWGEKVMFQGTKGKTNNDPKVWNFILMCSDNITIDGLHKRLQNSKMKRDKQVPPRRAGVILGTKAMSSGVNVE
jgi:hypothetical protein